jgi:hypothetical protein
MDRSKIRLILLLASPLLAAQPLPPHNLRYVTPATVWDEALPLATA